MHVAAATAPPRMSIREFEAFVFTRPDEERWELIGGVPVMTAPVLISHQVIAGNIDSLLRTALRGHDPSRMSVQRIGLDLGPGEPAYRPEPDVAVIDADISAPDRYAKRFYMVVEILSNSDLKHERDEDRAKIEIKRDVYRHHDACSCVMVIEPDRYHVEPDQD